MLFYCGNRPSSGNSGCVYIKLCRYFQTVIQSDRTILSSHRQYIVEFKLFHILTNTWHFSLFFKLAILMNVQRYRIMVLIFILMTNEMEHHFIYQLTIWILSLEVPVQVFSSFLYWVRFAFFSFMRRCFFIPCMSLFLRYIVSTSLWIAFLPS